jgi:putative hydrolase of the HAD superfamily
VSPYRAVIFDYGGVLTTPLQDAMVEFATELGMDLEDFVRVALAAYTDEGDPLVVRFETGQISEEDFSVEFAGRLSQAAGKPVDPKGLPGRVFASITLEEAMLDAVASIRRHGFKTALLSNSWGLDFYPRDRFDELFDVVVISGEVGLRKPDPGIFSLTVEQLAVAPEACVFVDDHPGHLQAAGEQRMTTVLHRSPTETIAELESLLGVSVS